VYFLVVITKGRIEKILELDYWITKEYNRKNKKEKERSFFV